ncbi:substrate-binding domain-containing protein [Aminobacter aminovorans]|uniref:Phosphate ABC transporter substrate-binding protein n=1 Tax=Aminobacter aminovorans TaxID=83263 RepID=A0AAC8YLY1_AMIAI|nr:substrate-binding domain-containing protein [Aminobacter aminovorans]AMS40523.1 phosphate ABC transporter substrate-binding protein [Aminobacter aminovorans]MBB3706543.1 phosphate transport system substrate-binding protein [Aminobacter aminovorans]WMC96320.1 substrate-binding domain-containing protein [Aminobacter aminovorans]
MKKALLTASAAAFAIAASAGYASARDQIQVVGSSTVFPFTTAVAEKLGQGGKFKTPVVESTGTGGGMKLFCSGVGENTPDFTNASRAIKSGEIESCKAAGVTPVEIKVGFDGIVIANAKSGAQVDLTKEQIFKALAKNVAIDGKVVANPYVNWADIDAALPATKIEVLGPPPTSGTRDAFVELVMLEACQDEVKAANEKACAEVREDGAYVEAGENDNLIVQKLEANSNAFGVFGFSFLDQNADKLQGHKVDGVEPTFENIASGEYKVSRSLFVYAKKEHVGVIPGMQEFIAEYTSEGAWGPEGYLADKGLIPLPDAERASVAEAAKALKGLGS